MLNDLLEYIASDNIAELLDQKELNDIGAQVVEGYDADRSDRGPWEDKMKKAMDYYMMLKITTLLSRAMFVVTANSLVQYREVWKSCYC